MIETLVMYIWPREMIPSTASVHASAANVSITTLFPVFFYKVGWVTAHLKCTSATMTICCFDFDSYMYTPEWMTNLHIAAHQNNWQIPFGYPQVKNIFSLLQLGKSFCHFAISSFKHAQCKTTQSIFSVMFLNGLLFFNHDFRSWQTQH